jgi:hypothetical protein
MSRIRYNVPTKVTKLDDNHIQLVHTIDQVTMKTYIDDDNKVDLKLIDITSQMDDETLDEYNNTPFSYVLDYQHRYINGENITEKECDVDEIDKSDNDSRKSRIKQPSKSENNIINGVLIWGDPHIKMLNGETYKLADDEGIYPFYQGKVENRDLRINAEMWKLPKFVNHSSQILRDATFLKKLAIMYDNHRCTIDLINFNVNDDDKHINTSDEIEISDNIHISAIKTGEEDLFNKKVNITYRDISIGDIVLRLASCPNEEDIQNYVKYMNITDEFINSGRAGILVNKENNKMYSNLYQHK